VELGSGLPGTAEALADGLGEVVPVGKGEGLKTRGVRVVTGVVRVPRQAASMAQAKRAARHSRRLALRRNFIQVETIEESCPPGGCGSVIIAESKKGSRQSSVFSLQFSVKKLSGIKGQAVFIRQISIVEI
jgi:CRISPR/Cas system Type II protein with McrA/HNH and RuvC-like nuclease domain